LNSHTTHFHKDLLSILAFLLLFHRVQLSISYQLFLSSSQLISWPLFLFILFTIRDLLNSIWFIRISCLWKPSQHMLLNYYVSFWMKTYSDWIIWITLVPKANPLTKLDREWDRKCCFNKVFCIHLLDSLHFLIFSFVLIYY
jgi:hypothetical protein